MKKNKWLIIVGLIVFSVCLPVKADQKKLKWDWDTPSEVWEYVFFTSSSIDSYKIEIDEDAEFGDFKLKQVNNINSSSCLTGKPDAWTDNQKELTIDVDQLANNNGMCQADVTFEVTKAFRKPRTYTYHIMVFGNQYVLSKAKESLNFTRIVEDTSIDNDQFMIADFSKEWKSGNSQTNYYIRFLIRPEASTDKISFPFNYGGTCVKVLSFYDYLSRAKVSGAEVITADKPEKLQSVYDMFRKKQTSFVAMLKVDPSGSEFEDKICKVEMFVDVMKDNGTSRRTNHYKFLILLPGANYDDSGIIINPVNPDNPDNISNTCEGIFSTKLIEFLVEILDYVKIIVPLLILVLGSVDLLRNVFAGKDEDIKKGWNRLFKRFIYGLLVYVLIYIVSILFPIVNELIGGCFKFFK